ncbi:endonuclease/exonuclease/phosphatase family protein [Streptomyces sp. NPDC006684]|uniref:endonuclease/exonuclease/phosphatase family protein n=1 Tax=Streptomyces sp. NPDC006684 TaxID=3154477 RepID=UPI0034547316
MPVPSRRHTALTVASATATALAAGMLLTAPASAAPADGPSIHTIQGTTRVSPYTGQHVTGVSGVVTGVRAYGSRGFWFQETKPDHNPATSEGVFVFTSSVPKVAVGDAVRVDGDVVEYVPGGAASGNQAVTEIEKPSVTVVSSGNEVPAPVVISADTVPDAFTPRGRASDNGYVNGLRLRPTKFATDYYESLEGMNVRIGSSRVVGATDPYSELWVTVKPHENTTERGGTLYHAYDAQNGGRLQVQQLAPVAQQPFPVANVGDTLAGTTEGPMDFNQYGGYTIAATTIGKVRDGGLVRESAKPGADDELSVATYNVENLDPTDPQEKFDALADGVVTHLASPDIVSIEEVQDDNGAKDDGTVSAERTLKKFTDAIVAAGGPRYAWRGIDPENDKDGGEPGGNIRQVFLYNPDRVSFTDRAGGDATTATAVVERDGAPALAASPGRVDPANPAWQDSRKPLAGEFVFRGETVFVVANHFNSKGGDQPLTAAQQPPVRGSETQRHAQAASVNAFVRQLTALDKKARVVVLGDLNDFEFSDTTKTLTKGNVLRSGIAQLPADERYTYVYQGNSQVLDQILVSKGVKSFTYDSVHINAEFAQQNSDHDPQLLRFRP